MMTDFYIYAKGICSASVCSSLPKKEVKRRMARELTGVGPWQLSKDKTFSSGKTNPCPCNKNPMTHAHYLFNC